MKIESEFLEFLNDDYVDQLFMYFLDGANTHFSVPEYQDATLVLAKKKPSIDKFLNFKETSSITQDGTELSAWSTRDWRKIFDKWANETTEEEVRYIHLLDANSHSKCSRRKLVKLLPVFGSFNGNILEENR